MDEEQMFDDLVWELQQITDMTKREVLRDIYPGEVKIIQRKNLEHRLNKIIDNSCIMGGDEAKEHFEELQDRIEDLKENKPAKPQEINEEYIDKQLDKLKSDLM